MIRVPARVRAPVNVNTTDATTGATALLLPAQNTHTLHDPIRDPEHARAGGVEMVWASAAWMAVEMLATWCVRKLRGDARPVCPVCPVCVPAPPGVFLPVTVERSRAPLFFVPSLWFLVLTFTRTTFSAEGMDLCAASSMRTLLSY